MRFPHLGSLNEVLGAWRRMVTQYERDYEALAPSIEDVTLGTGTTTTPYYNLKLRPTSVAIPVAKNSNAASMDGIGTFADTPTKGKVDIHHSNSADARIYRIVVMGD